MAQPCALECFDPPPSSLLLAEWPARLGQDLSYPPDVGGWAGGRDWLSTQNIIGRINYAAALVEGCVARRPPAPDLLAVARRHADVHHLDDLLTFYAELLTGAAPQPAWRKRLWAVLGAGARLEANNVRTTVALIVAAPEAQLI